MAANHSAIPHADLLGERYLDLIRRMPLRPIRSEDGLDRGCEVLGIPPIEMDEAVVGVENREPIRQRLDRGPQPAFGFGEPLSI